jgi:hypothetical protein
MKEKVIEWSDYIGVCTDSAGIMAGSKETADLN